MYLLSSLQLLLLLHHLLLSRLLLQLLLCSVRAEGNKDDQSEQWKKFEDQNHSKVRFEFNRERA